MVALAAVVAAGAPLPRSQDPVKHDITITGRDGAFTPSRLDVGLGDIVKLTLVAEGSPCSFVIDAYRISKRATPDHPVTFEFRADRAGTFAFYCDSDRRRTLREDARRDGGDGEIGLASGFRLQASGPARLPPPASAFQRLANASRSDTAGCV